MTKSESPLPRETESLQATSSRKRTDLTTTKRIDCPHEAGPPVLELPATQPVPTAAPVVDEPAAEQIRLQADQLAGHLRSRQKELDYREAEMNARIAKLESEARAVHLWLDERENDLATRGEELAKHQQDLVVQQREVEKRLARLATAEAAQQKRASASAAQLAQKEGSDRVAAALAIRKQQLDEAEMRLAEAQAEAQHLGEQLSSQRRTFAEEVAATREQIAAEQQQALAELEQKRQAVQRRADHVDQCRAALKDVRSELERMHRETLEIRLATEELWVQLSGAAPPAALTRSLGSIRTKLAVQYRQANAELADQKKELETVRSQLLEQHEALVEQRRRFEQWVAGSQEACHQEASRLAAREQQFRHQEVELREQSQRWQAERMKCQQEIRRLQLALAEREEAAVLA